MKYKNHSKTNFAFSNIKKDLLRVRKKNWH